MHEIISIFLSNVPLFDNVVHSLDLNLWALNYDFCFFFAHNSSIFNHLLLFKP